MKEHSAKAAQEGFVMTTFEIVKLLAVNARFETSRDWSRRPVASIKFRNDASRESYEREQTERKAAEEAYIQHMGPVNGHRKTPTILKLCGK